MKFLLTSAGITNRSIFDALNKRPARTNRSTVPAEPPASLAVNPAGTVKTSRAAKGCAGAVTMAR
jgi:hypothetical protein